MKTVIFDIGNVLVDYDWESYLRTFHYEEKIYQRIADAVFRNEDWAEGDIGRISAEEWLELFIENAPDLETEIRQGCSPDSKERSCRLVTRKNGSNISADRGLSFIICPIIPVISTSGRRTSLRFSKDSTEGSSLMR